MKNLHAIEFDGTTFGMEVDASREAYKKFKKAIKKEGCIDYFGNEIEVITVPYVALAGIMEGAHRLVSERQCFHKIRIDGLLGNEYIYVKYSEEKMDFRNRFS